MRELTREDVCGCEACQTDFPHIHSSDCAVHNEPAEPKGSCSCGATFRAERRYVAWLGRLACIQFARWRTQLRSWWLNGCLGR